MMRSLRGEQKASILLKCRNIFVYVVILCFFSSCVHSGSRQDVNQDSGSDLRNSSQKSDNLPFSPEKIRVIDHYYVRDSASGLRLTESDEEIAEWVIPVAVLVTTGLVIGGVATAKYLRNKGKAVEETYHIPDEDLPQSFRKPEQDPVKQEGATQTKGTEIFSATEVRPVAVVTKGLNNSTEYTVSIPGQNRSISGHVKGISLENFEEEFHKKILGELKINDNMIILHDIDPSKLPEANREMFSSVEEGKYLEIDKGMFDGNKIPENSPFLWENSSFYITKIKDPDPEKSGFLYAFIKGKPDFKAADAPEESWSF